MENYQKLEKIGEGMHCNCCAPEKALSGNLGRCQANDIAQAHTASSTKPAISQPPTTVSSLSRRSASKPKMRVFPAQPSARFPCSRK